MHDSRLDKTRHRASRAIGTARTCTLVCLGLSAKASYALFSCTSPAWPLGTLSRTSEWLHLSAALATLRRVRMPMCSTQMFVVSSRRLKRLPLARSNGGNIGWLALACIKQLMHGMKSLLGKNARPLLVDAYLKTEYGISNLGPARATSAAKAFHTARVEKKTGGCCSQVHRTHTR